MFQHLIIMHVSTQDPDSRINNSDSFIQEIHWAALVPGTRDPRIYQTQSLLSRSLQFGGGGKLTNKWWQASTISTIIKDWRYGCDVTEGEMPVFLGLSQQKFHLGDGIWFWCRDTRWAKKEGRAVVLLILPSDQSLFLVAQRQMLNWFTKYRVNFNFSARLLDVFFV